MHDVSFRFALKIAIVGITLLLLPVLHLARRRDLRRTRVASIATLCVLAVAAAVAYVEFGHKRFGVYMNPHDFYHYYMGSKYFDEVGYDFLYEASLVADSEQSMIYDEDGAIRRMSDYTFVPVRVVIGDGERYKSMFTEARWQEFKSDIDYFQSLMPAEKWNVVLRDRGYNPTPVWNTVAGLLTTRIDTDNKIGMLLLLMLDPLLLACAFIAVWIVFGPEAALLAAIFFGTNFMMTFVHIKGALLRLDWVVALIIGMCLLQRRHYKIAAILLSYAGAARVFPLIFLFGMGMKPLLAAVEFCRRGEFNLAGVRMWFAQQRQYFEFFGALLGGMAALLLVVWWDGGTWAEWKQFFIKISLHNEVISSTRVGLKYVLLGPWVFAQKYAAVPQIQPDWYALQTGFAIAIAFCVRKLRDYETIALSFVMVFAMTAPTFYYYVMLIVPLFLFIPRLDEPSRVAGAMACFGFSLAGYGIYLVGPWGLGPELSFLLSTLILALCLICIVIIAGHAATEISQSRTLPSINPFLRPKLWLTSSLSAAVLVSFPVSFVFTNSFATPRTETVPTMAAAQDSGSVEMMFVGDIMLGRNVIRSIEDNGGGDFRFPFLHTAEILQKADIAFANLECPISDRGRPIQKRYVFRAPPQAVDGLAYAGFDVVSLANNHILDYGADALEDTMAHLARAGIAYVGLSKNGGPGQEPVIIEKNGQRVGFLAYADPESSFAFPKEFNAFTVRPAAATPAIIASDLNALRARANVIVVSLHWGTEYESTPNQHQKELARFIIDTGALVVAGHHPHVLQPAEEYKNGYIMHSLGNFVFDQKSRPLTKRSMITQLSISSTNVRVRLPLPIQINDFFQPEAVAAEASMHTN